MEIIHLQAHDQKQIRLAFIESEQTPKAIVQLVHGFGEAIEHYIDLAESLAQLGYCVFFHDQRGFGPEAVKKGVTEGYDEMQKDISTIAGYIKGKFPELPLFLMGHSMGGNIVINHILRYDSQNYQGLIVESPWLGLHRPPGKILQFIAKKLGNWSKNLTVSGGLTEELISHNPKFNHGLVTDGIYHTRMSMRLFTQVSEAGNYAIEHAKDLKIPTILFCALEDQIVSVSAIQKFHERSNLSQSYTEYAGGYHCLHADENKAQLLNETSEFIERILVNK